jgi:ribonuclease BN (tRNA processing enzyme)
LDSDLTTKIVLLGTGTPNPDPERFGSALAIVVNERPYLVDFGPGVVRRAASAYEAGLAALAVPNLNRAFLTHLHSDHTAGYPDLIFTPWVVGRADPLTVYGPAGLQSMTDHILAAYEQDIHERLYGLEPANTTGYQVNVHEIAPGIVYRDEQVTVEAFPVSHGSWQAFGYTFTTPDRRIVISGDTCPVESLVQQAAGCDVLIHEVYSATAFARREPEWQRYHAAVHTSTHQLAELANKTRPGLVILYHQLFWGVSESDLLAEIRERYDGEIVSGADLAIY